MTPHASSLSENLAALPFAFWVAAGLWCYCVQSASQKIREGIGFPMLAVLGTVAVWYFGDVLYNDYAQYHSQMFPPEVLDAAWWEVSGFLIAFVVLVPGVHAWLNGNLPERKSYVVELLEEGVEKEEFQKHLTLIFYGTAAVWGVLLVVACLRLGTQVTFYLFPFLGHKTDPWARGRIGTGSLDAIIAMAGYLQILVGSAFGVVAALSNKSSIRSAALVGCFLTWPYYLFDRTRSAILVTVIPGILAWTFFRFRGNLLTRIFILIGWFLLVEAWLHFVGEVRSEMSVNTAFQQGRFSLVESGSEGRRHEGLNMYEELCWLNLFLEAKIIEPNWGERYLADLVNPIPRALWPGKPTIGIDYAVARGMGGGEDAEAGVVASVSTGMIGQAIHNFGRMIGPPFAALLMALWAAALARLDLQRYQVGGILLYLLGFVLTFNMGRDITLLTLYPFIFGWMLSAWLSRRQKNAGALMGAAG